MLVINSNSQNWTVNNGYSGYPDVHQLLFFGNMNYFKNYSGTVTATLTPTDFGYLENSRGYLWNDFTPAIPISSLGMSTHTPNTDKFYDGSGIFIVGPSGRNSRIEVTVNFTYNIGMKNIPVGKVVGRKCYGSVFYYGTCQGNGNPSGFSNISNTISFYAVHSDGTSTLICSFNTSGTDNLQVSRGLYSYLTVRGGGESNGYTTQDGDWILCQIQGSYKFVGDSTSGSGNNGTVYGGCNFGGNSWTLGNDIDGFRPFQCSIEDE